jgi:hypothetical protein
VKLQVREETNMPDTAAAAQISASLRQWTSALASGQGESPVTALYAPDAILLATFDPKPLDTPAAIAAYFHKLTQNPDLRATIHRETVQLFGDGAADSGLYTFSYTKDGAQVRVPARFVFVYRRSGSGWLIVSHHSSVLPEAH